MSPAAPIDWVTFAIDPLVIAFVVLLALAISLVAGLAPALKATGGAVNRVLKESAVALRFGRVSAALVVTETAVAVAPLGAASMLGRGMLGFDYHPYGLPEERILISQLYFGQPPEVQQPDAPRDREGQPRDREGRRAAWEPFLIRVRHEQARLAELLASEPGVRHVSFATSFPGNEPTNLTIAVERNAGPETAITRVVEIDDRYLEILETRMLLGRSLSKADVDAGASVALVNHTFARRFFGTASPLGGRLRRDGTDRWSEIVGVLPDLGINPGDPSQGDAVYFPLQPDTVVRLAIKVDREALTASAPLLRHAATLAPRPHVQWARSLGDQLAGPVTVFRALGVGLSTLGIAALLLACMGTYAIVAFSVAQRHREIAIRMALGARWRQVVHAVVGPSLRHLGAGALVGCGLSFVIREAIAVAPFAIERGGLGMLAAMLMLVIAVGSAACAGPLYRALTLTPGSWLRE